MIVINFAHPLTAGHREQIEMLTGQATTVMDVVCHLDEERPFAEQVAAIVDQVPLTAEAWQTEAIVVNPPGYAPATAVLVAELHGRMGHFPSLVRMRPMAGKNPREYEVAELLDLQVVRDEGRQRRVVAV